MTSEPKWFDIDEIEKEKEEVEDEVLEAVEEAKEEEAKENEAYKCVAEGAEHMEAVMDEEPKPEPKKRKPISPHTIRRLRELDRHFNRTCSACVRRLPLEKFLRGKQDEVCIDCLEK